MGKKWVRETASGPVAQPKPVQGPVSAHPEERPEPVTKPPPRIFKGRANVWKRDASHLTARTGLEGQVSNGVACENGDAAKRRRLAAQGRLPTFPTAETAQNKEQAHIPSARQNGFREAQRPILNGTGPQVNARNGEIHTPQKRDFGKTQAGNESAKEAKKDPGKSQEEELEKMKQQIAQAEANFAALKEDEKRKRAHAVALERQRQEEHRRRKERLESGLAEAFQIERESTDKVEARIPAANEQEVKRVLSAKSDYDVMQLRPGVSRLLVKKKYRSMTMAIHPDKCKVTNATDAFQRLVTAYQGVLKSAI